MRFGHPDLLFLVFLFLHIGGAIVAFGPTFTFPIIGAMGGREPQFANFAARISGAIEHRLVVPLAIFVGLTGVGLIWTSHRDIFRNTWLLVAIVLYVIALSVAIFVATPLNRQLVGATAGPPPTLPAEAYQGSGKAGPPPHIAGLVKRSQRVGMILALLLVSILLLMVFKPTL